MIDSFLLKTRLFFSVSLIVSIFCVNEALAVNIVTNPGFESGTTGWTTWGSTITASTAQPHSGSYSCYNTNRSWFWQSAVTSVKGLLTPGVIYRVSARLKMGSVSADKAYLCIKWNDSNGDHYWGSETVLISNNTWTPIVGYCSAPTPNGTLNSMDLYVCYPETEVSYYLDDVSVETAPYTAQDVQSTISLHRDCHGLRHAGAGFRGQADTPRWYGQIFLI